MLNRYYYLEYKTCDRGGEDAIVLACPLKAKNKKKAQKKATVLRKEIRQKDNFAILSSFVLIRKTTWNL